MTETQTKSAAPLWRRLWPVYVIAGGLLAGWRLGRKQSRSRYQSPLQFLFC